MADLIKNDAYTEFEGESDEEIKATLKLSLKMAIFSHLSDVQEMLRFQGQEEKIRMEVNYVKMLVSKLSDGVKEMTENELNSLWQECHNKFGKKG
jgi:hypothetical protein